MQTKNKKEPLQSDEGYLQRTCSSLNGEILMAFPLKPGTRKNVKKWKGIQIGK